MADCANQINPFLLKLVLVSFIIESKLGSGQMNRLIIKVLYLSRIIFVDSLAKGILPTMSFLVWSDGALVLGKVRGGGIVERQVTIAEAEKSQD